MAQRSSRSSKNKTKKNPELRTGGGRTAKAERSRARQQAGTTGTGAGPAIRMRPSGTLGMLFVLLLGWLGALAIAGAGIYLDRWNILSYPDSLWLYVSFGVLAMATAVGRVGRSSIDADSWGIQALLVPLGLLIAEQIAGPSCPTGGLCSAIGTRGALGLVGSIIVIVLIAGATWGIARWQQRAAAYRRPTSGRVRYYIAGLTMLVLFVFPGLVFGAALIALDTWVRPTPALVKTAQLEVERECYGLANAPAMAVRGAPTGYNPHWATFAVRRANESRPGIGKAKLPSDWANLSYVHPYEATISFNVDEDVVQIDCRRIGPGSGNAVKDDLKQEEPDSNPISPKTTGSNFLPRFFTQGVAGPTEEGKKLAADQAKKAAAAKKAEAAKAAKQAKADDAKADGAK